MLDRWPVLKEVLHLLMPMVLTLTLELSISMVDTLMLGNYSPYHLAAVGLASSLWTPVGCFLMGITFGLTPLVTRHLHGRQMKMINIYMSQTLGVCLTVGLLAALTVAFILPYFAIMMATEEETQRVSAQYLQILENMQKSRVNKKIKQKNTILQATKNKKEKHKQTNDTNLNQIKKKWETIIGKERKNKNNDVPKKMSPTQANSLKERIKVRNTNEFTQHQK